MVIVVGLRGDVMEVWRGVEWVIEVGKDGGGGDDIG